VLTVQTSVDENAKFLFEPVREGVLSWNSFSERGEIEFRILRAHVPAGEWIPYASWTGDGRHSYSAASGGVEVDVETIRSTMPFDGIEVRAAGVEFKMIAFAAPVSLRPSLPYLGDARILDVAPRSQYVREVERGWCSPAAISMINAYFGLDYDVETTARAVFDRAYNGTGNWTFNVAFSGSLGLRAAVVYLQNLDHAQRLVEAGIPLAISYGWRDGELPGAPLPHSDGHFVVLCGFTSTGDCAVNDPATPNLRIVYPRGAIETLWQRNNGIAYAIAPAGLDFVRIVNS
jgi:hypothetical protein